MKLTGDPYRKIKENKFYKYPWYWVYQKDVFNSVNIQLRKRGYVNSYSHYGMDRC